MWSLRLRRFLEQEKNQAAICLWLSGACLIYVWASSLMAGRRAVTYIASLTPFAMLIVWPIGWGLYRRSQLARRACVAFTLLLTAASIADAFVSPGWWSAMMVVFGFCLTWTVWNLNLDEQPESLLDCYLRSPEMREEIRNARQAVLPSVPNCIVTLNYHGLSVLDGQILSNAVTKAFGRPCPWRFCRIWNRPHSTTLGISLVPLAFAFALLSTLAPSVC